MADAPLLYRAAGYVRVPGRFAAAEALAWQAECDRLWRALERGGDPHRIEARGAVGGGMVPDRIDPVLDISPDFAALAADARIVDLASRLLEGPAALMKAKLIIKRPGTNGYLAHQDYPYWAQLGLPANAMLTVQVSIDAATAEQGALELFPALHHEPLPAPAGAPLDVDASALTGRMSEIVTSAPGDLLCFHSLAPHRSGPNRATQSRRALFFTYVTGAGADIYERYHAQRAAAA